MASDFQVIATDGGLMPAPATTKQLRVGMAERYEIVIDFAKYKGSSIELRNLGVPNSTDYDNTGKIMRFDVGQTVTDSTNNQVPPVLNPNMATMGLTEADAKGRTTKLEVMRSNGEWQIRSTDANGTTLNKTWEGIIGSNYTDVVSNPAVDEVQIWEITNKSGGWFHPVHIHLVDFKMLTRNGKPVFNYEQGPKDVMYVGENETIRAVMRFGERSKRRPAPTTVQWPLHDPLPQPPARGPRHDDSVPGREEHGEERPVPGQSGGPDGWVEPGSDGWRLDQERGHEPVQATHPGAPGPADRRPGPRLTGPPRPAPAPTGLVRWGRFASWPRPSGYRCRSCTRQ